MVYLKRPHLYYPMLRVDQILRETAERLPDKPAFLYPSEITYRELDAMVSRFASGLLDVGVEKGGRVAIYAPNSIEWVVAYFGIIRSGCTVVPMSPMYKEYELEYHLKDSEAACIVVQDELYSIVRKVAEESLPNLDVIVIGKAVELKDVKKADSIRCFSFKEIVEKGEIESKDVSISVKEDLAVILYTAGTTGTPKGVMLSHYNIVSNALQFAVASEIHENDISIIVLPLYHSYALHMLMLGGVWTGVSFVVTPRFNMEEFCDLVERYRVTVAGTTSAMIIYLTDYLEKVEKLYDWSSWRLAIIGAAPVPKDVMERIRPLLSRKCRNESLVFQHGWGLSEASPCVALNPFYKNRPETQGIALSDIEAKVIDSEGRELPPGEIGEIVLKGPNIMMGYLKHPEEGFILIDGERWLKTGDLGYIDEEGYHHLIDRIKEVIKYKGHTIAPAELEALLLKHEAVFDVAVVGKPDPTAGEIPKAFVALKDEYKGKITQDELINWVKERIAEYKRIREVEFVDSVPRSPAGKVLRRILKEQEEKKS